MPLDYGIKVSKAGFDIATAIGNQLIFKSDSQLIKVAFSGTVNLSTTVWTEITHNLGYVPQFLAYLNAGGYALLCTGKRGPFELVTIARADTTKLYISPGNVGNTAYYYIFYEQA